jgi:hypothetical protein
MEGHFGLFFSCPWVTEWLRVVRRVENIFEPSERSSTPKNPLTGLKVIDLLNLNPFTGVRQIAAATVIPGQLYLVISRHEARNWDI